MAVMLTYEIGHGQNGIIEEVHRIFVISRNGGLLPLSAMAWRKLVHQVQTPHLRSGYLDVEEES